MLSLWEEDWEDVWGPSDRPTLHKPEIRRPLDIAPGEFGEERRRWICKCGSSYTIRMDRLMAAFVKYAPSVEHAVFDLRFGIEL
jgi:hypothetical protein